MFSLFCQKLALKKNRKETSARFPQGDQTVFSPGFVYTISIWLSLGCLADSSVCGVAWLGQQGIVKPALVTRNI